MLLEYSGELVADDTNATVPDLDAHRFAGTTTSNQDFALIGKTDCI